MKMPSARRKALLNILSGIAILSLVVAGALSLKPEATTMKTTGMIPFQANPGDTGGEVSYEPQGPSGPFTGVSSEPTEFKGDLHELIGTGTNPAVVELEFEQEVTPLTAHLRENPSFVDSAAQNSFGYDLMPDPILNIEGLVLADGGGWHPPDTNGEVGVNDYVETVNIAIGVYDKATGTERLNLPYNSFFSPAPSPCNNQNRGDPIVNYDPYFGRWLVSDFSLPDTGPVYQCLAISQGEDPVTSGWFYYAFLIDTDGSPWHDYPKLSVWSDGYYMTANMFDPWSGARVWALDRNDMLIGAPIDFVAFNTGSNYGSLLPSNVRGDLPPVGSPAYFLAFDFPSTLHLWRLHVDWSNPGSSTFTGPIDMTTEMAGYISSIPQKDTAMQLDSLGDRLMFMLQYRNFGDYEALYVNHSVMSGGVGGVRWYEVRDPNGEPFIYQQGTYQPDNEYRWMGSIAADQEGNLALGYSVSSSTMFPGVRYTGRLASDPLGTMPQGETSLFEGLGSQTTTSRWGDYSAMTVDPVDDCTFWYTQMYMVSTSGNWTTRIGSFKFPSCGLPKGWIDGVVTDSVSGDPLAGVPVQAAGSIVTTSAMTGGDGSYLLELPSDTYTLTAGPLMPGYPISIVAPDVDVTAGITTTVDFALVPAPYLVGDAVSIDDSVAGGNGNGFPEPGEVGLLLTHSLQNTGAAAATGISGHLVSLTPGVTVDTADSDYPDIAAGASADNVTPFVISIDPGIVCGNIIDFENEITTDQGSFTVAFSVQLGAPGPIGAAFFDDVEGGINGWTHGGAGDGWAIRTNFSHSPTHSWTDSNASYPNNMNAWLMSPVLDLSNKTEISFVFWHRYAFEEGYDFGYVEYSLDGSTGWTLLPSTFTGNSTTWTEVTYTLPELDDQATVYLRFRSTSDGGVTADGWYVDDVAVDYRTYTCVPLIEEPGVPSLVSPADGTVFTNTDTVTLTWTAGAGGPVASYELDVDGSVVTTTETSAVVTLPYGAHTWSVRAFNAVGNSAWTEPWDFSLVELFELFLPLIIN